MTSRTFEAGGFVAGLLYALLSGSATAQPPGATVETVAPAPTSLSANPTALADASTLLVGEQQARSSIQWLASHAISKLPRTYAGDKDWGETKKLWAGVKVRRDGLKIRTKRRFREVEQGRWIRYEVARRAGFAPGGASLNVDRVAPYIDEATGDARWRIQATIVSPMDFQARIQRWNLGVRLFSMTVTGEMRVRLAITLTVGFQADYSEIPPALVIDPHVELAHLDLERFEVERVSRIGGDAAEQWGELLEETLADRFIKKQNERLASKLNKAIDKERDDLRISMADWLTEVIGGSNSR